MHAPSPFPPRLSRSLIAFAVSLLAPWIARAQDGNEIGYLETYALAGNRAKVLEQLIPGTEDYYYFHALHAQTRADFAAVERLFEPWISRHGETPRYREIRHRQALLRYREDPRGSLDYLIRQLGLAFNHQRDHADDRPDLPEAIAADRVTWEIYRERAFRASNTLSAFEDSGVETLLRADVPVDEERRRDLLGRLRYPDFPRLVGLIAADLRSPRSRGFGEFEIHRRLLPEQLDELLVIHPPVGDQEAFVHLRLRQMRPGPDIDWTRDPAEREAYLTRLWDYCRGLDPVFNSLKAHALYQLLQHHQRAGRYPRDLFLEYLRLPRAASYMEPRYLQDPERQRFPVNLGADFTEVTACPPIHDDESLVRDYLLRHFVEDDDWQTYAPFIRDGYLKAVFAEAKLTQGLGDAERWYSLLSPAEVRELKDRVDLEFATGNPEYFAPGDPVSLDLHVKNVGTLMVKVYEINTLNYYLEEQRELNTDLDLDGLVANEETTHEIDLAPILRQRRTFTFDSLAGRRGAWVIEFIGNGRSSRALVRKGRLQYLSEITPAGVAVTVLTADNQPARSPSVWFGGREYRPAPDAKSGIILLPFTREPGTLPVVLTDGDFATFETIGIPAENYTLRAGFHIERETLLPGKMARVAVRPDLRVNGAPASVTVLDEPRLTLRSIDHEGVESVIEVPGFALFDDRESVHEFRVPERLANLRVELGATVRVLSDGDREEALTTARGFGVNSIDASDHIADAHLSRIDGEWTLEVLGKSGEPVADRAVNVRVKHRDFTDPLDFTLKTSKEGRVRLSTLLGHESVEVFGEGLPPRSWRLDEYADANHTPASLHGVAGEPVRVPVPFGEASPERLALLETRGGVYVADAIGGAEVRDGLLLLTGLAPGDYELYLRETGKRVAIRVTAAKAESAGYALSDWRHLQLPDREPLQIASLGKAGERLSLRLVNAGPMTRVHLVATRFVPQFSLNSLGEPNRNAPTLIRRGSAETLYVSGRDIGDEYRYILERRAATKFPGNLLPRPALLLNPWALRDTETVIAEAREGGEYEKKAEAAKSQRGAMVESDRLDLSPVEVAPPLYPSYDFLRDQAPLVHNLTPDGDGVIEIDLKDLGDRQHVQVLAVDESGAAFRSLSLAEGDGLAVRDLRLTNHLDPARHFSQRQRATVLKGGESLTLPDVRSSEFEIYDTLGGVWSALDAIHQGEDHGKLAKFSFLLDWPALAEEKKRALYSEHACHELNFFLSRRDPGFFASVIRPYLANKRSKTFLDDYLLANDLTAHAEPWAFGRLNIVERILLARRLGGDEPAAVARHARDLLALSPVTPGQRAWYFQSALRGRGMDGAGRALPGSVAANGVAFADSRPAGLRMGELPIVSEEVAPMSAPAPADGLAAMAAKPSEVMAGDNVEMLGLVMAPEGENQRQLRELHRALFRKLEATREWAENHYHELPIAAQVAELVTVNAFWRDYAAWDGEGAFFSREFPAATGNFTEMMFVLSVLDLPFGAAEHDLKIEDGSLTLTAKSPAIIFHEEVEESPVAEGGAPILIGQNFFRADDRYVHGEEGRSDKFVIDEFLTGVLYGGQVVVTNPTSSSRDLDVLLQIPRGALPAAGARYTDTRQIRLEGFSTEKLEYFFYFPAPSGEAAFPHYAARVSDDGRTLAWAESFEFKVVDRLSTVDKASWEYLSQHGTEGEVLAYLEQNNVHRLDLGRVAWRCRENVDFFRSVVRLLGQRHAWDATIWSYGLHHGAPEITREYLLHREDFLAQCGQWLESELVSIDPVARHWYQHLEYSPLVNARAHRLGRERAILNDRFREQYRSYLKVLGYRPEIPDEDALSVAGYLLLQDRVEEGLEWLARVDEDAVAERLQLDYLRAYAALYRESVDEAAEIAGRYAGHPVDRWRERFARVTEQVAEIRGAVAAAPAEGDDREHRQERLAAGEANFELRAEGREVTVDHRNLDRLRVNYYEMDLEFLFSSNPFVSEDSARFSHIRPNVTLLKELPEGETTISFEIPEQFASRNVLVEIVAGGQRRGVAVYANALRIQLVENFGQIEVRHADTGKPLPKTYVKAYARFRDGGVRFFKDGYTDLRGKFDYVSLNTDELGEVERLSLLVLSEEHGALVREVAPPRR